MPLVSPFLSSSSSTTSTTPTIATAKKQSLMIKKGELLAKCWPYVYALLSDERQHRCEYCFQSISSSSSSNNNPLPLKCEQCNYVYYCSVQCMNDSARTGFHAVECRITAQRPLRNLTRLIARVLVRQHSNADDEEDDGPKKNEEEKEVQNDLVDETQTSDNNSSSGDGGGGGGAQLGASYEWIQGHKRDWNCLMDHYDDIIHDATAMRTFEYIYEELELLFDGSSSSSMSNGGSGGGASQAENINGNGHHHHHHGNIIGRRLSQLASVEQLIRIYGKILVNSFAIHESSGGGGGCGSGDIGGNSLRQIGRAVYLGPSIFDHSCQPDAMFTFDGIRLFVFALHDISPSPSSSNSIDIRHIYISYIDEFETLCERRRQLKASFYFDCQCKRCMADENSDDNADDVQNVQNAVVDTFSNISGKFQPNRMILPTMTSTTTTSMSAKECTILRSILNTIEELQSNNIATTTTTTTTTNESFYCRLAQKMALKSMLTSVLVSSLSSSSSSSSSSSNTTIMMNPSPVTTTTTTTTTTLTMAQLFERIRTLLQSNRYRLDSIQIVRLADFYVTYDCHDAPISATTTTTTTIGITIPRLMERLIGVYRRYYGEAHPRLLYKIYHYIGILLYRVLTIYQCRLKRNAVGGGGTTNPTTTTLNATTTLEDTTLALCFEVIGRLYRQARVVQQFLDQCLRQSQVTTAVVAMMATATGAAATEAELTNSIKSSKTSTAQHRKQLPYKRNSSSYRELIVDCIGNDGDGGCRQSPPSPSPSSSSSSSNTVNVNNNNGGGDNGQHHQSTTNYNDTIGRDTRER